MYFDYLSTTPLDHRVYEAMSPYWTQSFGNPHSADHAYGYEAQNALSASIAKLDQLLPKTLRKEGQWIFTSGATEANNLALKGLTENNRKRKILVSAIEHSCVLETAKYLQTKGYEVIYLPVTNDGILDLNELQTHLTPDVVCCSVMWANNETGVIQPIQDIAAQCRNLGVLFHSDAAQAFGKIDLDTSCEPFPDMISISGHKLYGPKGIGALWVHKKLTDQLTPLIHGGGQQNNLRSGTLPTPLVVGLGKAVEIALNHRRKEEERLGDLRNRFEETLREFFPDLQVNGEKAFRLSNTSHIQIPGVDMGELLSALPEIAVSRGSACSSEDITKVSHVMAAMRMEFFAHECLRISFGRPTTDEEVAVLAEQLMYTASLLRS